MIKTFESKYGANGSVVLSFDGHELQVATYNENVSFAKIDFQTMEKMYWFIDGCIDKAREECSGCHHERDGCQTHG